MVELQFLKACDLCGSGRIVPADLTSDIYRCLSCGYVFDNPRPTAEEVSAFYSKPSQYDPWVNEERARDILWNRRIKKMSRTRNSGSLLDVGTGIGQFLHHAANHYSTVVGTEVSESGVDVAKRKYGLRVRRGDILTLDFPERSFDNVTLFHVLEHVPSPKALILKCRELLEPGGFLVVAVPNDLLCLRTKVKILLKHLGNRKYGSLGKLGLARISLDGDMREIHVSHFTPKVLGLFLASNGFTILEDSIDPLYAATGIWKVMQDVEHFLYRILLSATGIRLYPAIWMVAKKKGAATGSE